MTEYQRGRDDIVKEIKEKLTKILDNTNNSSDLMLDFLKMLKNLK